MAQYSTYEVLSDFAGSRRLALIEGCITSLGIDKAEMDMASVAHSKKGRLWAEAGPHASPAGDLADQLAGNDCAISRGRPDCRGDRHLVLPDAVLRLYRLRIQPCLLKSSAQVGRERSSIAHGLQAEGRGRGQPVGLQQELMFECRHELQTCLRAEIIHRVTHKGASAAIPVRAIGVLGVAQVHVKCGRIRPDVHAHGGILDRDLSDLGGRTPRIGCDVPELRQGLTRYRPSQAVLKPIGDHTCGNPATPGQADIVIPGKKCDVPVSHSMSLSRGLYLDPIL